MIRAVLLDAGNTLFRERSSRGELYAKIAAEHGIERPAGEWERAMRSVHARLPRELDGHFRYTDPWFEVFVTEVFRAVTSQGPPAAARAALFATWRDSRNFQVFADVRPALERFHRADLALAVVSNWTPHLGALLHDLELAPWFSVQAISAIEGLEKPQPEIFELALERLGVLPHQALHIGDRADNDVAGAQHAGLTAWKLDRTASTPPTGDLEAGSLPRNHVLASLLEAADRLSLA